MGHGLQGLQGFGYIEIYYHPVMPSPAKVNSHYTIVVGYFLRKEDPSMSNGVAVPKQNRLDPALRLEEYLDTVYYDNYLESVLQSNEVKHLTNQIILDSEEKATVQLDEYDLALSINYFDLYCFPRGFTVFSMHLTSGDVQSISQISAINNLLRNPECKIHYKGKQQLLTDLCTHHLEQMMDIPVDWTSYLPQLKTYTNIDLSTEADTRQIDQWLFELASGLPIGSVEDNTPYKPSRDHFDRILSNHKISVFENWSALSLLDSFVRISRDYPDTYSSWENDYFLIYVHCIYQKFYLYVANSKLTDVTKVNRQTRELRNRFTEFINDNNFTHISYKFLPNELLGYFRKALDLQDEIDTLEKKLRNLDEANQQRKSRQMGILLLVLSILSVFSVIQDLSEWLVKLGVSPNLLYGKYLSPGIGIVFLSFIVLLVRKLFN